jgi:hypothetical protein
MYTPLSLAKVAKDLRDLHGVADVGEAYSRSIANRAYYAAYGVLRGSLESHRLVSFGKSGRHKKLVEALVNSKDTGVIAIGVRLNKLKARREHADYELNQAFSHSDAELSATQCEVIALKIQAFSQAQLRDIASRMV